MKRLLVQTPYATDANSFYRCIGPWGFMQEMARKGSNNFSFDVATDSLGSRGVAWNHVAQFDAVFLHRPCQQDQLTILKIAKNLGKPVWVDFDDDLFGVPYWNPHAQLYSNPGLQNIIATCLAAADIVSVSTSALYDKFRLVNPNVVIIPNQYRSDIYGQYRAKVPPKRNPTFAWRGTNTHDADLLSVKEGFKNLPGKITFYGGPNWQLTAELGANACHTVAAQDPFLYMRQLYHDAPKVMLVPLVDCFFNRCKSNIAYQEALHAGAICVAPEMPEWKRPGVVTYEPGNALSFHDAAQKAFSVSQADQEVIVAEAFEEMKRLYDAPVINEIREATFEAMLSPEFVKNTVDPFDQRVGLTAMAKLSVKPNAA